MELVLWELLGIYMAQGSLIFSGAFTDNILIGTSVEWKSEI